MADQPLGVAGPGASLELDEPPGSSLELVGESASPLELDEEPAGSAGLDDGAGSLELGEGSGSLELGEGSGSLELGGGLELDELGGGTTKTPAARSSLTRRVAKYEKTRETVGSSRPIGERRNKLRASSISTASQVRVSPSNQ